MAFFFQASRFYDLVTSRKTLHRCHNAPLHELILRQRILALQLREGRELGGEGRHPESDERSLGALP